MSKSCGGTRRNRYFHGPLRFIARASCLFRIRIDFVWEEKVAFCRKNGNSERYLLAFVPNSCSLMLTLSPSFYARRDTKVSQISDWRIASKIARRVNNRYVFVSRGTSRGMSAFWMHPRVSHDDGRCKEKKKRLGERGNMSGKKETVSLHNVEVSLVALLLCKSELRSRNWLMPAQLSILICSWLIKISEKGCDLSCFRL